MIPGTELFRRLKPLLGEQVDRAWIAYNIGTPEDKREIELALTIIALRRQGIAIGNERIVLDPPAAALAARGNLVLGDVEYPGLPPYPVRLEASELLRHLFLLGPSGTGKTTFIIGLLRQLLKLQVPFWIADFKRNFRCLINDDHGHGLLVLSVGRNLAPLRVNMLQPPPGVSAAEWVESLSDLLSTAYLLMHGARNVLKAALLGAVENPEGTLRAARDLLATELARSRGGSRRYGWLESSYRALDELTKGDIGDTLCAKNPSPLQDLLDLPVVFELQGLGDDQKRCVCLYLLQWLLLYRKHHSGEREVLRHVLCFDEAHHVFPKDQWGELGLPSRLVREVREYGEAVIAATQQLDVADSLVANSGCKIIMRTDGKDVDLISKFLQVDVRWITRIPTGHAIIRLPTRFFQSFLISFSEQPLKNMLVSDQRVHERYTQWTSVRAAMEEIQTLSSSGTAPTPVSASEHAQDARAEALLRDIAAFPISTVTERYARLGWNPKAGNAVKDILVRDGLAGFVVVELFPGRVKVLCLTDNGIARMQTLGVGVSGGLGGVEHEFWRARIKERCQNRGYTVESEYAVADGRVDLCISRGLRRWFIEIETGKSDVLANVRKCGTSPLVLFFTTICARDDFLKTANLPPTVAVLGPDTLSNLFTILG